MTRKLYHPFFKNWISDNIMEGVKLQIDARNSATSVNFHFQP